MNRYITASAIKGLKNYLRRTTAKAIYLDVPVDGGLTLQPLFSDSAGGCIMLCASPKVLTNRQTLKALEAASIDFDDVRQEFIFRLRRNEPGS